MFKPINFPQYISISLLFVAFSSIKTHTSLPISNTIVWWVLQTIILLIYSISIKYFYSSKNNNSMNLITIYLIYIGINTIRGTFLAENYWDWKYLTSNIMNSLIPISAFIGTNVLLMNYIPRYYLKYGVPLFFFVAFFITTDAYGFYLMPITFFLLFFPVIKLKWKIILLFFVSVVVFSDFGARSNIIKFTIPLVISLLFYLKRVISNSTIELVRKTLFVSPLLFLILALLGIFNILEIEGYISGEYIETKKNLKGEIIEENIKADTRTFLYEEVLLSAKKHNSWVFGRSPARGNDTNFFFENDLTGRGERYANEAYILNIFTWHGIIGIILYSFIFYRASYLAVNKSNNIFSKIIGIYIAFRFMYMWIEDYANFSLNTFFLWFVIGICFSKEFRLLKNSEVKIWILSILESKYNPMFKKVFSDKKLLQYDK